MSFAVKIVKGLVQAEADDPAVRRAIRALESAVIAAAIAYLSTNGVPFFS